MVVDGANRIESRVFLIDAIHDGCSLSVICWTRRINDLIGSNKMLKIVFAAVLIAFPALIIVFWWLSWSRNGRMKSDLVADQNVWVDGRGWNTILSLS